MIRSGKKSKDNSTMPSRGSSLRGPLSNDAKRTVLRLENDDWSDEDTELTEITSTGSPNVSQGGAAPVEPLDMASVAQMMKSTVRKRSPKGVLGLFSFSRNKKHGSLRSGTETKLQDAFAPASHRDSITDEHGALSQSQPSLSPSSSSSSLAVLKGAAHRKKKGSFLKTGGGSTNPDATVPSADGSKPTPISAPSSPNPKIHRRSSSMVDAQALISGDLNSILIRQGTVGGRTETGTQNRNSLSKKDLKELEKKEKKAKKEAKKEAKRLLKQRKEKDPSKAKSSANKTADLTQHRYTAEMTSLPSGFDPSMLKVGLTPVHLSQRMGSPSRLRPGTTVNNASGETIKVDLATGKVTEGTMEQILQSGAVDETLARALSAEHLPGSAKDKRQSFVNLQLLASDLNGLNFGDFPAEALDLADLSLLAGHGFVRSASVGPLDAASDASSLYSENSSIGGADTSSTDDDDSDDSDSSSDSSEDEDLDDASVASSVISNGWASSLASSIDESEVELNRRALESGIQVELIRKIGKGASGIVWYGLLDGRPVAVKQIELREASQKRSLEVRNAIKREVELLQSLNCVHVVRYFGMFASKAQQQITLIMELIPGLPVTEFVLHRIRLSERFAAFIIQQVLEGLKFLEENKIIHRDVKPDNMLITASGLIKMIDFGTAASLDKENVRKSTVGTPWYCAPEVIRSEDYSYPADIWSLGCTLLELLTGKPPYDDLADVACLFKMAEGLTPPLPPQASTECQSFLKSCLAPLPQDRLSAATLLQHPWITNTMADRDSIAEEIAGAMETLLVHEDRAKAPK